MKWLNSRLLLSGALILTALAARAETRTWRGNPVVGFWSEPSNWDPRGVPQDGDELRVDQFLPGAMVNDLTNLTLKTLQFEAGSWLLTGNELGLGLSGQIGNSGDGAVEIRCGIRLSGAAAFVALSGFPSDSSDLRLTGPINLNGHPLRLIARKDATLDLAGAISGTGNIDILMETLNFFSSAGEVRFSGGEANSFSGAVTLGSQSGSFLLQHAGATLILDKESGPAIPGALFIGTNGTVKLDRPHQIADHAAVSLGAGAALLLQGHTESIGALSMVGSYSGVSGFNPELGRSVVDTGGATLSVSGSINASNFHSNGIPSVKGTLGLPPGDHSINVSGNQFFGLSIEAKIVGDGGFTKTGPRGLALSGPNSFNGEVIVAQGVLAILHDNGLGSVAGFTVLTNTGVLVLNNATILGESLFARGNVIFGSDAIGAWVEGVGTNVWSGPVILDTNLLLTGFNGGVVNLNGLISGPGGLRCLSGIMEISGTDANTFTGATIVRNPVLLLNKTAGVAAFGGPLIVGAGDGLVNEVRWLQDYQRPFADVTLLSHGYVNLNGHRDDFGAVTFNGGSISTGAAGELGLYGLLTVNAVGDVATIEGRVGLPPGIHEFRVHDGDAFPDLHLNAALIGAGHLRKTGAGQVWLAAPGTYTGVTFVDEGTLSVLNPDALGAFSAGTTVNEGGALEINFVGTVREPLALRGRGPNGNGALNVFGGVTLRNQFPSLFAPIDLTTNTTIGVGVGATLTVDGFITGTGDLTKIGPGTLTFAGSDHNTYSGETIVNEGVFIMSKPTGVTAVPGALSIGSPAGLSATAGQTASYQVLGNIFVNRNGRLNLNGQVENVDHLWLTEGGDVQTTSGVLFVKSGGSIQVVPGSAGAASTITGNLDMDAGQHVINVGASTASGLAATTELEIAALVTSSLGSITLRKEGAGILRLAADNTYSGSTVVNAGALQLDGSQPGSAVIVQDGGQLAGQGRTGSINFQPTGAGVRVTAPGPAPGRNPGILACSSFNSSGAGGLFRVDLNGTTAGSNGHDQLHVEGRFAVVRLDGVSLDASLNFTSAVSDQFVIIRHDGIRTGVIGQFAGLSEGTNFYIGSEQFFITYVGGDGNDVVLTRIVTPARPSLAIERTGPSAVRLLWPSNSAGFTLYSTTNLNTNTWDPVTPLPVIVGSNNVVTNPLTLGTRFYRLRNP